MPGSTESQIIHITAEWFTRCDSGQEMRIGTDDRSTLTIADNNNRFTDFKHISTGNIVSGIIEMLSDHLGDNPDMT